MHIPSLRPRVALLSGALVVLFLHSISRATEQDVLQLSLCNVENGTVGLAQLRSGEACMRVYNPASTARIVKKAVINDLHLRNADGSPSPAKVSLDLAVNIQIDPKQAAVLSLKLQAPNDNDLHNIQPGTYPGIIVVGYTDSNTNSSSLQQKDLEIKVTVPSPKAAVANLTNWIFRDNPFAQVKGYTFTVPLAEACAGPYIKRRYVLQNERGELAYVSLKELPLQIAIENLPFEVTNLKGTGKYEGQVQVSQDKGDEVKLVLYVKDVFIWPLLVMVLGIFAAQVTKQGIKVATAPTSEKPTDLLRFLVVPSAGEVFRSIVALAVAILTVFKAQYFGKPFGTLSDYVDIFVSGTTVKVAVDLLAFSAKQVFEAWNRTLMRG